MDKKGLSLRLRLTLLIVLVVLSIVGLVLFSIFSVNEVIPPSFNESGTEARVFGELRCSDGIDNDGDGSVDMDDFGCVNEEDDSEFNNGNTQCSDGIDNDGDGFTDQYDTGCDSWEDNLETSTTSLNSSGSSGGSGGGGGGGGSSGSNNNPPPPESSCEFTSSYWSVESVLFEELVELTVEGGSECEGEKVNFKVYKVVDGEGVLAETFNNLEFVDGKASVLLRAGFGGGVGVLLVLPFLLQFSLMFFAIGERKDNRDTRVILLVILLIIIGFFFFGDYLMDKGVGLAPGMEESQIYYFVAELDGEPSVTLQSPDLFVLSDFPDLTEKVLVLYNENYPDLDDNGENEALEIANHYVQERGIDTDKLCGVKLPTGQYGTADELLGARKIIVEDCICPLTGVQDCSLGNLEEIRDNSEITHMAIIKGIPVRLYGTGWNGEYGDDEEPSFDYYLSYLIYRNEDIFPDDSGKENPSYWANRISKFDSIYAYTGPIISSEHKILAYGRIEAMDKQRTFDLIDRTVAAEGGGMTGNFFGEIASENSWGSGYDDDPFVQLRDLTNTQNPECWDYLSYEPFATGDPLSPENVNSPSYWHNEGCERFGTTDSSSELSRPRQVPGESDTVVPFVSDAGLFIGTYHGECISGCPEELKNMHNAFDDFNNMLNWHKEGTDLGCVELCEDFSTQAEVDACIANSKDYFKEINTECVGVAPGFMAFQLRSYPVQYYGFHPSGWQFTSAEGKVERTMPLVIESAGDAYNDERFTDHRYLHYGTYDNDVYGLGAPTPTCELEDGSVVECYEHIGIDLLGSVGASNFGSPVTIGTNGVESKTYTLKIRYRHNNPDIENPSNLRIGLRFIFDDFAFGSTKFKNKFVDVELTDTQGEWGLIEEDFTISSSEFSQDPLVESADLVNLGVLIRTDLTKNLKDFIDIDGIEVIDADDISGANVFPATRGSFTADSHKFTAPGDWAPNVIDRLGGIASWGSSSHHETGGFAFKYSDTFIASLFSGRTLGESLVRASNAKSGIVYGDPLYRPVASKIYLSDYTYYGGQKDYVGDKEGYFVWFDTYQDLDLRANVLHGISSLLSTNWAVYTCTGLDVVQCDSQGAWELKKEGQGAGYGISLGGFGDYVDVNTDEDFILKLRVWNEGSEDRDFTNYAYFRYEVDRCISDINRDGEVSQEDETILKDYWGPEGYCVECPINPDTGTCVADFNRDGKIGVPDLLMLGANFCGYGELSACTSEQLVFDLNGDGIVDTQDSAIFYSYWGWRMECPYSFESCYPLENPELCVADLDRDLDVDEDDFDIFDANRECLS